MIDFGYLYKGLCGLARAHRAGPMAGHLGAAVVAGYFFGEEHPDLDEQVHSGVEQELERIIRGEESIWFDAQKVGVSIPALFEAYPEAEPQPDRLAELPQALSKNIARTRQSGHNVIFTAIALRALRDHSQYATPAIIDGMRRLIARFDNAPAGRGYYGTEQGWLSGDQVMLGKDNDFPAYADLQAMVDVVMDELVRTAAVHRRGFGGLWHLINHAAGLIELSTYGFADVARQGLAAHHHHVRLYRSLPDVAGEFGPMKSAEDDPRTAKYWNSDDLKRDEARLTHRIKTLYGFSVLARTVADRTQAEQAWQCLRYLMG